MKYLVVILVSLSGCAYAPLLHECQEMTGPMGEGYVSCKSESTDKALCVHWEDDNGVKHWVCNTNHSYDLHKN
jgi:hypothetical protein